MSIISKKKIISNEIFELKIKISENKSRIDSLVNQNVVLKKRLSALHLMRMNDKSLDALMNYHKKINNLSSSKSIKKASKD